MTLVTFEGHFRYHKRFALLLRWYCRDSRHLRITSPQYRHLSTFVETTFWSTNAHMTTKALRTMCFLPAGLRIAQPWWYCFYSMVQKWVYRPAGATRCPINVKFGTGSAPPCQISQVRSLMPNFTFIGANMWEYSPKNCQNFEFWPDICTSAMGDSFAIFFTKFSAIVRVYR